MEEHSGRHRETDVSVMRHGRSRQVQLGKFPGCQITRAVSRKG